MNEANRSSYLPKAAQTVQENQDPNLVYEILMQTLHEREQRENEPQRQLLQTLQDNPLYFMSSKEAFIEGAEQFLFIKDKEDRIRPWRCNNTQHMILNALFAAKEEKRPVRIVILKGRQQGCSTGVGAVGFMHMMCYRGANLLIATEEKQASGKNIYNMYRLYNEQFPVNYPLRHDVDNELIEFGPELNNGLIRVTGERRVTSFTYKFIHLSEAAMFEDLDGFMDMMLETVPMHLLDAAIFVESTAEDYGDMYHELWQQAEDKRHNVGWEALFIPWFVHEEYEIPFRTTDEREQFAESLNSSKDDTFGDEVSLLKIPPIVIPTVNGEVKEVGITLENLKWRRDKIAVMKFSLPRFYRQYPSTSREAFLTAVLTVLDRDSLDWYTENRVYDPETKKLRGTKKAGEFFERDVLSNTFTFEETRHPIVQIFEEVRPYHDYLIGVDMAQGLESGDFSCAIVVCRLPFRVVARLRGLDGRRLDPLEFGRQLLALGLYYNTARICPENNADGGGVCQALLNWQYPNLVSESVITGLPSKRYGWNNNGNTKKRMVAELQRVIREKAIDITDEVIIEEARHLVYKSGQRTTGANVQAAKKGMRRRPGSLPVGYYDDTIFALGGALLLESCLQAPKKPEQNENEERMRSKQQRAWNMRPKNDENEWLDYA